VPQRTEDTAKQTIQKEFVAKRAFFGTTTDLDKNFFLLSTDEVAKEDLADLQRPVLPLCLSLTKANAFATSAARSVPPLLKGNATKTLRPFFQIPGGGFPILPSRESEVDQQPAFSPKMQGVPSRTSGVEVERRVWGERASDQSLAAASYLHFDRLINPDE
jgi:hypothetical protein